MKRVAISLLGLTLMLTLPAAATSHETPQAGGRPAHAADHVLVKVEAGADVVRTLGKGSEQVFDLWRRQPVPRGKSPEEFVEELRDRRGVEHAELDYLVQLDPVEMQAAQSAFVAPNDPLLNLQWHFPAVQLEEAWQAGTGEGVVVAVIDSGISKRGVDLDCHTFVAPYNAITNTAGASAADDDYGHGSHVAGTVAQCTNNGVGVAGVAYDARLMPVKVLNASGEGLTSDIAVGIEWARTHGADVINMSLGCVCTSGLVDDAIAAAVADDIVIVAATGNDFAESIRYPAVHPDVIAVGATEFNNSRAPYSNRGSRLDLVAPGGNVNKDDNGDSYGDGVLQETFGGSGWGYYFFQGTSMASPHVAGAAAILRSIEPRANSQQIETILEATALDLGPSGFDNSYGHGLIQIHDAIEYMKTLDFDPPTWPGGSELKVTAYGENQLTFAWSQAKDGVGVTRYRLRQAGTAGLLTSARQATVTGLEPGRQYVFEVQARDKAGNWSKALKATVRTARSFRDTPGHLFYEDILWMSGMDVTRGCNPPANDLFCPDDPVTRGQMAAFLVRALGLKANTHQGFTDVEAGSTFAADIGRLATAGITRGCNPPSNSLFCPDDPVTRAQMAAFLVRALNLTNNTHGGFGDVKSGSTFAEDIGRLATAGITRGCNPPVNDVFCPEDLVSRGQLAAFLRRALG